MRYLIFLYLICLANQDPLLLSWKAILLFGYSFPFAYPLICYKWLAKSVVFVMYHRQLILRIFLFQITTSNASTCFLLPTTVFIFYHTFEFATILFFITSMKINESAHFTLI